MKTVLALVSAFLSVVLVTRNAAAQADSRASNSGSRTSASSPSMFSGSASRSGGAAGGRGQSGAGAAMGQNGEFQLGSGGTTTGSERYMRGNRQSGNFVGSDATEVSQFFSALTGGRAGAGSGGDSGLRANNNRGNDFNNQGQDQSGSTTIPHRLVVSFRYAAPRIQLPVVNASGGITLKGLNRLQSRGPLNVELRERTAILRGVVATDHDRALAETLTLLEPGISQVQNELTVAESLPTVEPATAPQ